MKRTIIRLFSLAALPVLLTVAACGVSPASDPTPGDPVVDPPRPPPVATLPPDTTPSGPVTNVRDQLTELGIDVAGMEGEARAYSGTITTHDEFAPLGTRARVAPYEIFAAGVYDGTCEDPDIGESAATRVLSLKMSENGSPTDSFECYAHEEGDLKVAHTSKPDAGYGKPGAQSTRTIAAGEFDGDGVEEGVVVYARPGTGGEWFLHSYLTNNASPFIRQDAWLPGPYSLGSLGVVDVEATVADLDGNGLDDLIVAVVIDDESSGIDRELRILAYLQTRKGDMAAAQEVFSHIIPYGEDELSVRLVAGNPKAGPESQLALVLRSIHENSSPIPDAYAHFWVLDGLTSGASQLSILQQGNVNLTHSSGSVEPFITADVTFGDFDGDGMDELAFTGILAFPPGDDFCAPYRFGYQIFDDLELTRGSWTALASRSDMLTTGKCDDRPGLVYEVFAHALTYEAYDGGLAQDLLANNQILRLDGDTIQNPHSLDSELYYAAQRNSGHFSEASVSVTVGDFDGDGLDEIAVYTAPEGRLEIFGRNDSAWDQQFGTTGEQFDHPRILAYDNDEDGIVVEFNRGSHRVVLTEPVIIAALAIPPYDPALGQNPAGATTSFGEATTIGREFDTTVTVSSGIVLGKNVGGSIGPIEFSASYSNSMSRTLETTEGTGYQTTFTTSYTTAERDAVFFTSFPYDAYDYTIVAAYEPWMVGDIYTVMLPRTPVTRIVSAEYYDARVPPGSFTLDEIFKHTAGDPDSYMSAAEKNDLQERVHLGAYGVTTFLDNGPVTPGYPASTSTSMQIEVSESSFKAESSGTSMDHTVEMSIPGNSLEVSKGHGESDSMTFTTGSSMSVSSTIPGMDSDDPASIYSTGMFTYLHRVGDPDAPDGQSFQVINFWVD